MERRKLLLVAITVGTALFFIIGIPLLLINPGQKQEPVVSYTTLSAVTDIPAITELPPVIAQDFIAEAEEIESYIEQPDPVEYTAVIDEPKEPGVTTITGTRPQSAGVPDISARPQASTRPAQTAAPARPAAAAQTAQTQSTQTRPPAQQARPAQRETAKPPVAAERPRESKNVDYWIQAGSFSTKVSAQGAKETLDEKGVKSIIENRDINGRTWYRVRVGPYVSENEAKFWLPLVKSINGFDNSMIFLSQR